MFRKIVLSWLVLIVFFFNLALANTPCKYYEDPDEDCGVCSGNYGCVIGSFLTIPTYSNGDWTTTGCGEFQCVEYVKRFCSQIVGKSLSSLTGQNAGNAFNDWHENDDLFQYVNGQTTSPPEPGDIYCQSGEVWGHVGIIKSVDLANMKVVIIDQNRSKTSPELPREIYKDTNGRYSIQSLGENYDTQGWLRDPDYNPTYTCQYHTQNPSGTINMYPGETKTFTVAFTNIGNTTWYSDAVAHPNDYVELKSCNSGGSVTGSFLYDSSWLNGESPCTFNASAVHPGQTAWFIFKGKVSSSAGPQTKKVYFRPNHSHPDGQLMSDWGGMHFQVNVASLYKDFPSNWTLKPIVGDWNRDGKFEAGVYCIGTRTFYLDTNGDRATDLEITYGNTGDIPLSGDWNNDGKYSIGIYRPSTRRFYFANYLDGVTNKSLTFGNTGDKPIMGDWNGNGQTTNGLRRPSSSTFYLDYNRDAIADRSLHYGDANDLPLSGDFNNNNVFTIALYRPSSRTFYLDYNNDCRADKSLRYGNSGDLPIIGDWNGNGCHTIGVFRPSNNYFYLDNNNDGACNVSFRIKRHVNSIQRSSMKPEKPPVPEPSKIVLHQNYPNPFNPETRISFTLPKTTKINLSVYNVSGEIVRVLYSGLKEAGQHDVFWNGRNEKGKEVVSGIYFCRLQTKKEVCTRKMVLLR